MFEDECNVIVSLIDFKSNDHDEKIDDHHCHSQELISKEFEWLRKMFKKPRIVPFSYNFKNSGSIGLPNSEDYVDIKISYRYNCILVITYEKFEIFDRNCNSLIHEVTFHGALVSVMDDVNDELYLIYTDHSEEPTKTKIVKFRLGPLLRCSSWEDCVVWSKETNVNAFGIDIFKTNSQRYLIVVDNFTDYLTLFNCENGNEESVNSKIKYGAFSLLVIGDEVIIPYGDEVILYQLELHEIDDENKSVPSLKVIKSKELPKPFRFYAMVYDSSKQYIILTSTLTNLVLVLRKSDLEIVMEHLIDEDVSGICLDETCGELLVARSKYIAKFK
ncbi:predicted protein [Naegleria gruberi]|uniref:Predicted protein n=1 Tax=Naegleria gruberi TaxID=5762 RepID=D2VSC5_NAEGR|nr:uncharacterized protein NAEGRDRAFT_71891 [Naegleria gruberi]EFC40398.1 predicted protein [Naegleria gruberi]|eukprot:XP_002673142.1 predicted protein [Naegleria gruberi strain NEG-M]